MKNVIYPRDRVSGEQLKDGWSTCAVQFYIFLKNIIVYLIVYLTGYRERRRWIQRTHWDLPGTLPGQIFVLPLNSIPVCKG